MRKKKRLKIRRAWKIKPATRIKVSNKQYDRKKLKIRTTKQIKREEDNE